MLFNEELSSTPSWYRAVSKSGHCIISFDSAPIHDMANDPIISRLVILVYEPRKGSRQHHLNRSEALSHAASIAWHRRSNEKPEKPDPPRGNVPQKKRAALNKAPPKGRRACQRASDGRKVGVSPPEPVLAHTVLSHGNSDAFNSAAVPINANVNDLVTFWKYHVHRAGQDRNQELLQGIVKNDLLNLQAEIGADAFLWSASIVRRAYRGESDLAFDPSQLQIKHNALKQLRTAIESGTGDSTSLLKTIGSMYAAAMFSQQYDEADLHAEQYMRLMHVVDNGAMGSASPVIFPMFLRFFVFGSSLKIFRLAPSTAELHFAKYIRAMLRPFVEWAEQQASLQGDGATRGSVGVKMCQENEALLACIRAAVNRQRGIAYASDAICTLYGVFGIFGEAMDCFKRARHRPIDASDDESSLPTAIDAAVLCTGFLITSTASFMSAGGQPRDSIDDWIRAESGMRSHKRCLEAALLCRNLSHAEQCARLWALYVGAAWETRYELEENADLNWTPWYRDRLKEATVEMELTTWNSFMGIMEQFVRVESVTNGDTNLRDVMFMGFDEYEASRLAGLPSVTSLLRELLYPERKSGVP